MDLNVPLDLIAVTLGWCELLSLLELSFLSYIVRIIPSSETSGL